MSQQRSKQPPKTSRGLIFTTVAVVVLGGGYLLWPKLNATTEVFPDPTGWETAATGDAVPLGGAEAPAPVAMATLPAAVVPVAPMPAEPQPAVVAVAAEPSSDDAFAGLSAEARDLLELRRQLDRAQTELQVHTAQAQIAQMIRDVDGVRLGTSAIPTLVGVTGSSARGLRAEFHLGGNQRVTLGAGGWITPEWQLLEVSSSAVEVKNKAGERTHLVLGSRAHDTNGPGALGGPSARMTP